MNGYVDKAITDLVEAYSYDEEFKLVSTFGQGRGLSYGRIEYLFSSTYYIHIIVEYVYKNEYLSKNAVDMLELNASTGLLSIIIKNINNNINLDWIVFGNEETTDTTEQRKYFDRIKHEYPNAGYQFRQAIIESPETMISKKYDLIVFTEVFEHFVSSPISVLNKLGDALKEDGILYISTPIGKGRKYFNSYKDMLEYDEIQKLSNSELYKNLREYCHPYEYSKDELDEIFELVGLEVVEYSVLATNKHHSYVLKKRHLV